MSIRIPYGRQTIEQADLDAVADVLRSDWLTQGPKVAEFESALASYCGVKHAVAVTNGTAALQAAYFALDMEAGDEFVTSPLTFAATATAGIWQGAKPVFADVDPETGNLDPESAARAITPRTKALVPVDFAGRPAELDAFRALARTKGLSVVEDACHALGASYRGKKIGAVSDLTVFSFHPVKSITTGEGGAILTNDDARAERLRLFRTHGIRRGDDWEYSVDELGQNLRLTDIQSALGLSQLGRLDRFVARRRDIADRYQNAFASRDDLRPLAGVLADSAWHLFVVRLSGRLAGKRREVFQALRARGIGVQVHYIPVYWHPYYRSLGYQRGLCPRAEALYESVLSLPIYPTLKPEEQEDVIASLREVLDSFYAHRASS